MYKFRTMKNDSHTLRKDLEDLNKNDGVIFKIENDPRIIKGTSLLRNLSLDELPQLFSVLKGDMSFVGPRPALYNQYDLISLRTQEGVDKLVPGITGWAQVNGRDELSIPDKVALDVEYLNRQSFWFDVKILWMTFLKVIKRDGVSH